METGQEYLRWLSVLGCLEAVLEEGNRKDWFGSELIIRLTVISVIALSTVAFIELRAKQPFIDLGLFFET